MSLLIASGGRFTTLPQEHAEQVIVVEMALAVPLRSVPVMVSSNAAQMAGCADRFWLDRFGRA
jgi:hypothetical protein